MLYYCLQLRLLMDARSAAFLFSCPVMHPLPCCSQKLYRFPFTIVLFPSGTTKSGLQLLVYLIITDLEITASCLCQISCIRMMQHIIAVLPILYPQAKSKPGITPDIIIHRSTRFLCRQNQMQTKTAPDLRHTDQLPHKIRFLPFQLGKLINNQKQVRNCFLCFAFMIQPQISTDIIHSIFCKNPLSSAILTLNRDHSSLNQMSGKIRNLSG